MEEKEIKDNRTEGQSFWSVFENIGNDKMEKRLRKCLKKTSPSAEICEMRQLDHQQLKDALKIIRTAKLRSRCGCAGFQDAGCHMRESSYR